ncbi:MAG: phosphoribosyltransferase [Chloroflexi bacterium]|nr:phosphoribosyltransferase [Chloroflexota bacterium]
MLFEDRVDAGRRLATRLRHLAGEEGVVFGLPRGGVVVAAEVAQALDWPLDVVIARKIGAPGNLEYAIGAVAEQGAVVLNDAEIHLLGIRPEYISQEIREQEREIERRVQRFRQGLPLPDLTGQTAVLVDDGIATGFTMRAAVQAVRNARARRVVVAAPVAPPDIVRRFQRIAEEVICLDTPEPFLAVGRFYAHFEQVTDEEVAEILARVRRPVARSSRQ